MQYHCLLGPGAAQALPELWALPRAVPKLLGSALSRALSRASNTVQYLLVDAKVLPSMEDLDLDLEQEAPNAIMYELHPRPGGASQRCIVW